MSAKTRPATGCGQPHFSFLGAVWSLPNSFLGLLFALGSFALPRYNQGLFIAETRLGLAGRFLQQRGFAAMTLGRVVICVVPLQGELRHHEEHHVGQYGRLGPIFLPLYLSNHCKFGYHENPLETEAERCAAAWQARQR